MISILQGDCRSVLRTLPDESVHMCVTSPPYYGLRDYQTAKWEGGDAACNHLGPPMRTNNKPTNGTGNFHGGTTRANEPMGKECSHCGARRIDSQIGLEPTPEAYVAELVAVFREVRRVLRKDGTVFLNLGDSYFGGGGGGGSKGSKQQTNSGSLIPGHTRGGARRAIAYDKPGTALGDYPASDCFCQSLCDVCRAAYRIGKSHRDRSLSSMLLASSSGSILAHRELPFDHPPMSGLAGQGGRSEGAILDPLPALAREDGPLLDAPSSTTSQCVSPFQDERLAASNRGGECQLCGCSLRDCVPGFAHRAACSCDIGDGALADRTIGMDASGSAYQGYTTASLKPKDLIGIPWSVAFALRADGWWLRQDIIWTKPNPMPESVTDRCTKAHEYIFLLTKSERYYFDSAAIAEPANYECIAQGNMGAVGVSGRNDAPLIAVSHSRKASNGSTRNKRSVWTVATQPYSEAHFATFPPALIEPCILAGCPAKCCAKCGSPWVRETERVDQGYNGSRYGERAVGASGGAITGGTAKSTLGSSNGKLTGIRETIGFSPSCSCNAGTVPGTCLDPFGGAGTTGLVADRLQRNAILIELNADYAAMAEQRIFQDAPLFAEAAE